MIRWGARAAANPPPPPPPSPQEDRLENVHREMLYARTREEAHRNLSEFSNSSVIWGSLTTIGVVTATAVAQIVVMKRWFKRKGYL